MEIKKYKSGDEKSILELFKVSFKKEMTLGFWKWRFIDNPIGDPMIYLMWDNDILVGHYAVSPNLLNIDGELYKSALSMTTMTHPDYGGRGIFTKLATNLYNSEYSGKNLDVIWGFPNRLSHRGFIKNLEWKNIVVIPNFSLVATEFRFRKLTENVFLRIDEVTEEHIENRNTQLCDYRIKLHKDLLYYHWRYNLNPLNHYVIFSNEDSDFFIVKPYRKGNNLEVDIVEWCVRNDFNKMKYAINSMYAYFEKIEGKEIARFNLWLPLNDKRYINFELLGFTNRQDLTFLGYRNMLEDSIVSNNSWFYQMGDSDVY